MTGTNVMDRARVLLNDVSKSIFTDTVLLPIVVQVSEELQMELINNGVSVTNEKSAAITVPVGIVVLAFGGLLPADLLQPITLFEKLSGSSDEYIEMIERSFEPNSTAIETLGYWAWREQEIKFIGATTIRSVQIRYRKVLSDITAAGDAIPLVGALNYLATRTAAIAAQYLGGNETRGNSLNGLALEYLRQLLNQAARNQQALPARRKPFGFNRKYSGRLTR
jgi:hypothetical protein